MCNTVTSEHSAISTSGIHHLGLTVPDIKKTAKFFIEQLNFNKVGEKPDYPAIFVSDGSVMLTLWQVNDDQKMHTFDRKNNIGLHHFALKLDSHEQLNTLHQKFLLQDNIDIEFAPEALGDLPFKHMMCIIPGGIRLELISG